MTRRAPVHVGDKVRAARQKLKKTQYEVAVAAGLRPEVVSRIESGKSGASLASLHKLAPILDLSIDDLMKPTASVQPSKVAKGKKK